MPKLNTLMMSESGSAFVMVVAFMTLMTIAVGGFLGVARNTVSQEITELNDDREFFAAESGLILGSKMVLLKYRPGSFSTQSDIFGTALRGTHAVNGMDVTVDITVVGSTVTVTSTAQNPGMLNMKKKLSRDMKVLFTSIASGAYGVYLDNAYKLGGNTKGIRKMDWDGPAHFNTALQLGNPGKGNETHFDGAVTLLNINPATGLSVSDLTHGTGHFGNDYRYGVEGGSGSWDDEFLSTYNPLSDRLVTSLDNTGKTDINLNASDSGVTFGVLSGTSYYQYKNSSGAVTTVPIDTASELRLHIVNKGVAVSGSVKGKITVYTDPGKTICLPGNLTYADFSTSSFSDTAKATNYGYGLQGSNVLGLYSGADIEVTSGTHYISGQLFGVTNDSCSVRFDDDKKNKTKLYLFGTLAVNSFWDSKQGNDQATFQQLWDRRSLAAPGLGFKALNNSGDTVVTCTCIYSQWNETNVQ